MTTGERPAIFDIRTYQLVSGGRHKFDRIFRAEALPMLRRHGIRVVDFGPSLVDSSGYALIRSFSSLSERENQLSAFYGSEEWLERLDERVGALIHAYHVVVIETPARMLS